MSEKSFLKAGNPEEIKDYKEQYGKKARIIAGGTDLMVRVNRLQEEVSCFLYIGEAGLDYIREENDQIIIGGAATLTEIVNSDPVNNYLPLLKASIKEMGSRAIRNMATLAGNICNASPAADTAVPLLAYGAELKILSRGGERNVSIEDFFTGPGETVLRDNEYVEEIIVHKKKNVRWAYKKIGKRNAETLSVVSVGILMDLDRDICKEVKIALGAVGPTPVLATEAMQILNGRKINDGVIENAAGKVEDDISPVDDQRGTAWYRNRVSKNIVRNLLKDLQPDH